MVAGGEKLALTFCAWLMATVQVALLPEHAPPQEPKVEPLLGVAVRVTWVPAS